VLSRFESNKRSSTKLLATSQIVSLRGLGGEKGVQGSGSGSRGRSGWEGEQGEGGEREW